MADKTGIEWADATWPIVQGCSYVSEGCRSCYAVQTVNRVAHSPNVGVSGPLAGVVAKNSAGKLHWTGKVVLRHDRLAWPLRWKEPRKIFVPSHGDLFHEAVPDEFIDKVFAVMFLSPQHTFQLLTKQPERMLEWFGRNKHRFQWDTEHPVAKEAYNSYVDDTKRHRKAFERIDWDSWPLPNVWLGVSVENQRWAERRIAALCQTPAAVRFVSYEPALGAVDLTRLELLRPEPPYGPGAYLNALTGLVSGPDDVLPKLDQVIMGGESGPRARPMDPDWVRSTRDQCVDAGIAFFFKQWGGKNKKTAGAMLDGREWRQYPQVA